MNFHPIAGRASDWLSLAAAPAFAAMALLTAAEGEHGGILCSAALGSSSFSGMVPMYALMSIFHSAPWLRLVASRRIGGRTAI
jgi:hypothetical protein